MKRYLAAGERLRTTDKLFAGRNILGRKIWRKVKFLEGKFVTKEEAAVGMYCREYEETGIKRRRKRVDILREKGLIK